jgi:hypothetical protein
MSPASFPFQRCDPSRDYDERVRVTVTANDPPVAIPPGIMTSLRTALETAIIRRCDPSRDYDEAMVKPLVNASLQESFTDHYAAICR